MVLNASEDLDQAKARQRRLYVRQHPDALTFFRHLVASGLPLSVRQTGMWNDLRQYADLPVYPLEQITSPTLVLHDRAEGKVPFTHSQFVARTVPKVKLIAVEDCGHFIWVGTHASQLREQVLTFLRQHEFPPANPPEHK
jgi:pimeloyl-ACP methyl ester carboxylesterase